MRELRRTGDGPTTLAGIARQAIGRWMEGENTELSPTDARAHQRLLREFIAQHVEDGRPLRAYASWETDGLG